MTLIKSISGIRGTIGGKPGEGLTPVDTVLFASAYGSWLRMRFPGKRLKVVTGRDARISGPVVNELIRSSLVSLGIDVTDIGLATTPTVEIAVTETGADGGIIITASHNPGEWNALKLLNEKGEFLSAEDGLLLQQIAEQGDFTYSEIGSMGKIVTQTGWDIRHIEMVVANPLVNTEAIKRSKLTVVVDCVNSVGGLVMPGLLKALGVNEVIELYCEPSGLFPHNPEPLPENLKDLSEAVVRNRADIGIAVDPDVDRLAIVCEDGSMFGEEYTLVAVADYVLGITPGSTVSNMSSSRALKDVTERHGCTYYSSAVGEVNVVEEMKKRKAVIGGEGNGGVILPGLHYGRDALAGVALFLSHLAISGLKCSQLKQNYPLYVISKNKMTLRDGLDVREVYDAVRNYYKGSSIDERDGIKVENEDGWVQIRASNTEPIIRIYAEAATEKKAEELIIEVKEVVKKI